MATPAIKYRRFLATLEPQVRRGFEQSIAQTIARARINDLTAAIAEASGIEQILAAAGVTASQFAPLAEAIREVYKQAGVFYAQAEVPARLGYSFNMTNPRVNEWLAQKSAQLITGDLIPEQRRAVQIALNEGIAAGKNPRTVALDIVGRVGRNGRRSGGVIGLSAPQSEAYVRSAAELGSLDSRYFTRARRDRRYDAMVRRAIDSGTPLTDKQIEIITDRYAARLQKLRGDTVARTEAGMAAKAAGDEQMEQVFDEGLAERDAVQKVWDSTADGRARPDHIAMNGVSVQWDDVFVLPDGTRMSGPHDPSAPVSQLANCRCFERRIVDFSRTVL